MLVHVHHQKVTAKESSLNFVWNISHEMQKLNCHLSYRLVTIRAIHKSLYSGTDDFREWSKERICFLVTKGNTYCSTEQSIQNYTTTPDIHLRTRIQPKTVKPRVNSDLLICISATTFWIFPVVKCTSGNHGMTIF